MMKDSTMSVDDSQEELKQVEETSPMTFNFEEADDGHGINMQTELHSKGVVLTKAWSDLFSFITKYQAELAVKENSVEIAEKEIEQRKKQLEQMKPVVDAGNEDIFKLQNAIQTKETQLIKTQSELSTKEQLLHTVQSDLSCNMELLEKSRYDLMTQQTDLMRYRGDVERLKSELKIKQEQILIKDNLLKKLQNQLMKENAELKEQLELERRALELEKQCHEMTKRTVITPNHSRKRSRTGAASTTVIEIPDSPPTLDLSEEQDFGLSNIISLSESQTQPMAEGSLVKKRRSSELDSKHFSSILTSQSPASSDQPSHLHHMSTDDTTALGYAVSQQVASDNPIENPTTFSSSDTFFPLSVSEDTKPNVDSLTPSFQIDNDCLPFSKPGTPSSGTTSDSNQGPIPVSGPIPSIMVAPGTTGSIDGKPLITPDSSIEQTFRLQVTMNQAGEKRKWLCHICGAPYKSPQGLKYHKSAAHNETGSRVCHICGKHLASAALFEDHVDGHDNIKRHNCTVCSKTFTYRTNRDSHMKRHRDGHVPSTQVFGCEDCGAEFSSKKNVQEHRRGVHEKKRYRCKGCGKMFSWRTSLRKHVLTCKGSNA